MVSKKKTVSEKRASDTKLEETRGAKQLKRITKRKTNEDNTAPAPAPAKENMAAQKLKPVKEKETVTQPEKSHRVNTATRVKTITMEEVSKMTDLDEAFDDEDDDIPEVTQPVKQQKPVTTTTTIAPKEYNKTHKTHSKPQKQASSSAVVAKSRTVAAKNNNITDYVANGGSGRGGRKKDEEAGGQQQDNFFKMYDDYQMLRVKYSDMKNTKLDEAEMNTDSFYKNMQEHAKGMFLFYWSMYIYILNSSRCYICILLYFDSISTLTMYDYHFALLLLSLVHDCEYMYI